MNEVTSCLKSFKSQMIEDVSTLISKKLASILPDAERRKRRLSSSELESSAAKISRTQNRALHSVDSMVVSTNNTIATESIDQIITQSRHQIFSNTSNTNVPIVSDSLPTNDNHIVPSQQVDKFILHFRPITAQLALLSHDEWHEARRSIGKKLKGIRISFSRFNIKNGCVKIGFPSKECMDKAKSIIDACPEDLWSYESYVPALLLPKLTIYNIPLDFDLPNSEPEPNLTDVQFRDIVKKQLLDTILDKNDTVGSFVEEKNATLDVIYVQKHRYSCTAPLRVSPDLREHILNSCDSKLYVFSARCRVEDRFFYHQCFHCQKLGHMSNSCPDKNKTPVCMYCSGPHFSRECNASVKKDHTKQCCSNCKSSDVPTISNNCTGHSAASQLCPITVQYIENLKSRTQLTDPKNLQSR